MTMRTVALAIVVLAGCAHVGGPDAKAAAATLARLRCAHGLLAEWQGEPRRDLVLALADSCPTERACMEGLAEIAARSMAVHVAIEAGYRAVKAHAQGDEAAIVAADVAGLTAREGLRSLGVDVERCR
jgi:kynureninase